MKAGKPDVVLIVLDTTRASSLSVYGHARPTTPRLEEFARSAVRFDRCVSPSPWTVPAHASLFTGLYPSAHGTEGDNPILAAGRPLLATLMQRAGYRTEGISSNVWISDVFGFARGFDAFHKTWQMFQNAHDAAEVLKMPGVDAAPEHRLKRAARWALKGNVPRNAANALYGKYVAYREDDGARATNRKARRIVARAGEKPFFLFINYMEPHAPYSPPPAFIERVSGRPMSSSQRKRLSVLSRRSKDYHLGRIQPSDQDFADLAVLYDAEIAYLDSRVGELFDMLRASGRWDRSLVVVLGDHGENIGEHGLMAHRFSLHDTLTRVPLLVKLPGTDRAGSAVAKPVQLVDVLPTVLDVLRDSGAGFVGRPEVQGRSLLGSIDAARPIVSEFLSTAFTPEARDPSSGFAGTRLDRRLRSIELDGRKLIRGSDGAVELYEPGADAAETRDLASAEPGAVAELSRSLDAWVREHASPERAAIDVDLGSVVEDRLRELGYI